MDGLLIIDKPAGMTSHDVVARVRRIFGTRRVGHTGTLDPFATGVMVILLGKTTRLAKFLDKDKKEYIADVCFGYETDTGDVTGTRKAEGGTRNEDLRERLEAVEWEKVLSKFRGDIMQTPPMYSAKKIEGKKLYELARKGEEVIREPVAVTIHNLDILSDEFGSPDPTIRIRVGCSAGTYIRTLAEDIGREVGVGAHLGALRRTAAGRFDLSESTTLDELGSISNPMDKLLPVDTAVSHLAAFDVPDERVAPTRNGLASRVFTENYHDGEYVRMTDGGGELVAIGVYDVAEKCIQPKVVLI